MNEADRLVEFVGCDQWFDLLVAWIGLSPSSGSSGAAVQPPVAEAAAGKVSGVQAEFL